ncbi:hypothetical protein OA174_01665 [Actinomycetota bacterium]|nr:hypothetical protein [Actinomycetota bacterium]
MMLSRKPGGDATRFIQECLGSQPVEAGDVEILTWWVQAEDPNLPSLPERLEEHLTAELHEVIVAIQYLPSPMGALAEYQRRCDAWDRYDQSVKALKRRARDYPSTLEPFVRSLESLDFEAAIRGVRYTNAAWNACKVEITDAINASGALSEAGERPAMAKLPRSTGDLPLLDRAALSSLCTPSSLSALRHSCTEVIDAIKIPPEESDTLALVTKLSSKRRKSQRD